ncbi:L-2-hydroxyglutarate oxidase LhgO [Pseudomonas frederiksbergensis]
MRTAFIDDPGAGGWYLTNTRTLHRPYVMGPSEPAADFVISGPDVHGVPGLVNLFGIESAGLTSCLALADRVVQRLILV